MTFFYEWGGSHRFSAIVSFGASAWEHSLWSGWMGGLAWVDVWIVEWGGWGCVGERRGFVSTPIGSARPVSAHLGNDKYTYELSEFFS